MPGKRYRKSGLTSRCRHPARRHWARRIRYRYCLLRTPESLTPMPSYLQHDTVIFVQQSSTASRTVGGSPKMELQVRNKIHQYRGRCHCNGWLISGVFFWTGLVGGELKIVHGGAGTRERKGWLLLGIRLYILRDYCLVSWCFGPENELTCGTRCGPIVLVRIAWNITAVYRTRAILLLISMLRYCAAAMCTHFTTLAETTRPLVLLA
jgi:hypothetical protein